MIIDTPYGPINSDSIATGANAKDVAKQRYLDGDASEYFEGRPIANMGEDELRSALLRLVRA